MEPDPRSIWDLGLQKLCSWRCGRRQTWYHWVKGVQEVGDPPPPAGRGGWAAGCPQEGCLPETRLIASISPSAGLVPPSSPGPPQPAGLVIFLMPSAALGLADHSHLDTPGLNLLAFKTPASHSCPALGPWGLSLRPLLSLFGIHAARTHGHFSGLHKGPLYWPLHVFQVTASTLSPVPSPQCQLPSLRGHGASSLLQLFSCLSHRLSSSARSQQNASSPHLCGVDSMTPMARLLSALSSAGRGVRPGWQTTPNKEMTSTLHECFGTQKRREHFLILHETVMTLAPSTDKDTTRKEN